MEYPEFFLLKNQVFPNYVKNPTNQQHVLKPEDQYSCKASHQHVLNELLCTGLQRGFWKH